VAGDTYFSVDVETDGPIPGLYSMLAFGIAIAGTFDGTRFEARNPSQDTFYRELRPTGTQIDFDALKAARLDRDHLVRTGEDPATALLDAKRWIERFAASTRPILVGYPVVFDWMFMHWYFVRCTGDSPFGFSGALDMKTMYQQKAHVSVDHAGRDDLPPELQSSRPHTHNALDDAIEQADIFARLFEWGGSET
jgi:hypothetical protein